MDWTRRRLLTSGAALASAATGGCMSLDSLASEDTGSDGGSGDESRSSATPTPAPTPTPTPSVSRSGSATEQVVTEVEWFAQQYSPTVDRYLSTADRALNLIETLERQSSLSRADLDRLGALLDDVERPLYEELAPHFDAEPSVRSYNDGRLSELETLRGREDWDGVQQVLGEMASRYRDLATADYTDRTFPTNPVGRQFAEVLTGGTGTEKAGIVVYYAPTNYLARVIADEGYSVSDLDGGRTDVSRYDRLFDPAGIAAYRTARVFLTYTDLIHGRRSQPVFVQQYESEARADGAVRRMLSASGAVTAEGTRTLGGQAWREVFYQAEGGVTYAFLLRTGRYLLVVGPSRTPWDERDDGWSTPLARGWFWE